MAHDEQTRRTARQRYVHERQALPVIALGLGVPERTLRRWKAEAVEKGDNWDAARASSTIAGEGLESVVTAVVHDYVALHQSAIEDLKSAEGVSPFEKAKILASLADSFNKTVNSAGRLSPKISELGVAMDVLRRLAEFVSRHHPDAAPALLEVLEPFGEQLGEVYG
jgi:hypothetical protein